MRIIIYLLPILLPLLAYYIACLVAPKTSRFASTLLLSLAMILSALLVIAAIALYDTSKSYTPATTVDGEIKNFDHTAL